MSTIVKIWLAFCLLLGLVWLSVDGHAQTTILLPPPRIQFLDNLGKPLAGGFVFTYLAGTSIQQATYTDSTGATLNPNPIVLDAGGFASIYLTNATSYRIVVQNFLGVQQYVADNVRLVSSAQVGGSNTQIQYNCSGAFCGSSGLTYNSGTQTLSATALSVSSGGSLSGTFSGNPTFSGTVNFTGSVTFATFNANVLNSANCVNIASVGFLRLCRTDQINWRNNSNNGDEGIGVDPIDALAISTGGGVTLTGAIPIVRLGGETNAFPALLRNSTGIDVKLADNSASAPVSASTVTFNGIPGTGVTISGPCATGQVLIASSATAMGCGGIPATLLSHNSTTSLVNSAIPNSNTIVFSKAVTMPSTGCPCRVIATWFMYLNTANSGADVAYVSDGAGSSFAGSLSSTPGSATTGFGAFGGAGTSPVTYANNANVTFTVIMASSHAGGTTVTSAPPGTAITGAPSSQLEIDVLGSN